MANGRGCHRGKNYYGSSRNSADTSNITGPIDDIAGATARLLECPKMRKFLYHKQQDHAYTMTIPARTRRSKYELSTLFSSIRTGVNNDLKTHIIIADHTMKVFSPFRNKRGALNCSAMLITRTAHSAAQKTGPLIEHASLLSNI